MKGFVKESQAYYGAVIYATEGATAHLEGDISIANCKAVEGTVAYLIDRARFVLKENVEVKQNSILKRGLIYAISGSQFWIENADFSETNAEYDSAVVYASGNREQYHLAEFRDTI
jgi:hypothetical protein